MKPAPGRGERRISGNLLIAVSVAIVLVAVAVLYLAYQAVSQPADTASMGGSLFVSDSGQAKGGFEYTATYSATLRVTGGSGLLNLSLSSGLGDVLERHSYSVTDFSVDTRGISMLLDGAPVKLLYTSNDTVWNGEFDNYYVASWGSSAPASEVRGIISPDIFPGLVSHYYVELRLSAAVPG